MVVNRASHIEKTELYIQKANLQWSSLTFKKSTKKLCYLSYPVIRLAIMGKRVESRS